MPKSTQFYVKSALTGGLNDSVDPGMLPENDLTVSDNVLKSTSGARIKREGISYWDNIELPSISTITRVGTTVTVTFSEDINSATNKKLFVGEKITVVATDSQFSAVATPVVSTPSNNQITYVVAVTPTAASAAGATITRSAAVIGVHDFWYYDLSNNIKLQTLMAVNSDAQVCRYDSDGNRIYLPNKTYSVTFTDAGDIVTLNAHGYSVGDAVLFSSITSTTGIAINTVYFVAGTVTANTFQLSSTKGGSALTLTTNGSGTMVSPLQTTGISSCDFLSVNEACVITFDGLKNYPKYYVPRESTAEIRGIKGAPPNASIVQSHQARIIFNDKEQPDRIYYSSPFNPEEWSGYGTSGVIDVFLGDGDPRGIVSIDPPFKGSLFVKKQTKTYRIEGPLSMDYNIISVTDGLGGASQAAVAAIDLDDVVYVSYKGVHSLKTTANYGDFEGAFLSENIQNAFKSFTIEKLNQAIVSYVPTLNSIFVAFPTGKFASENNDSLYVYNTKFKAWDRWPNIPCASMAVRKINSKDQLVIGNYQGRILKTQNGTHTDYTSTAINFSIKTGAIYVDSNPLTMKAFKRIGFLYKPKGQYVFTAKIKIDNHQPQALAFTQSISGAKLGEDFVLGNSILAFDAVLAPYMQPIDGYGRGMTITVEQSGTEEQIEIYGVVVEWEAAEYSQEVQNNPSQGT